MPGGHPGGRDICMKTESKEKPMLLGVISKASVPRSSPGWICMNVIDGLHTEMKSARWTCFTKL